MKLERKTLLMITALGFLILASIPSVLFHKALKKYFGFLYSWDVAVLKLNKPGTLPKMPDRNHATYEIPHSELRFVKFSVKMPKASSVKIAADFNKWNPDNLALVKSGKTWKTIVTLPSGEYRYLYKIDNEFVLDPLNQKTSTYNGRKVSLLTVK
ncbi:MAG: glycogen-binding domain-containing protein [Elusimicrobiales bacterium]|nr:glycogen-binding domain-containing protein [Elusimicrobiales bacterium]MCK5106217.1 glycogen-binding domain-containing protein [Elusimicrobiales bacterium]MCK5357791.1 glycogen-binding domain-containing protein [Elusimicrobiales bacterium]MCK5583353.1 glycogen-binding domain-containing protein [Elusimicrobiales bacterium]